MTVLALPAAVTLEEVSAVLRTVEAAVAGGSGPLQLDASALVELDTSAVALALQAQRLARAGGRAFELLAPPPKLVALAQLYGVESLLSITPEGAAASSRVAADAGAT